MLGYKYAWALCKNIIVKTIQIIEVITDKLTLYNISVGVFVTILHALSIKSRFNYT